MQAVIAAEIIEPTLSALEQALNRNT